MIRCCVLKKSSTVLLEGYSSVTLVVQVLVLLLLLLSIEVQFV